MCVVLIESNFANHFFGVGPSLTAVSSCGAPRFNNACMQMVSEVVAPENRRQKTGEAVA